MIISDAPSPNFGPRAAGKRVQHLILHYTDCKTAFDALQILQSPERQVSAHYLVDTDGAILRLVPEEMRAWHAGKSWWEGETDINSTSVGIEIQNAGHQFGYVPFPDAQIRAVMELCKGIIERHNILPYHVLAHSDIAPDRKADPGELFPWAQLAQNHIGIWPEVTAMDELDAEEIMNDEDGVKSLLHRFGYDNRLDLETLVKAFQRHFVPSVFQNEKNVGIADLVTVQKLCAAYRLKLSLRRKIA